MTPRIRRTGTLIILAVLLAAISTGSLTICDALIFTDLIDEGTISETVKAGEEVRDFTGSQGFLYRFAVCPPSSLPEGVYIRLRRDTRGLGSVSVDIVTDSNVIPGNYQVPFAETEFFPEAAEMYIGTLDLTVTPPDPIALVACFYAYGKGEYLRVNQPISFYAYCSEATEANPIVLYKWWFNYNGNPNSTPDATMTLPTDHVNHTYSSAGNKPVRLVVRAQNGDEAATAQTITVLGL